jgi:hypothetical protein
MSPLKFSLSQGLVATPIILNTQEADIRRVAVQFKASLGK